ncbi:MAG: alpha/beta hydrolase [Cytophagales bacterium]|nr:alpha/beta hydrolase [Cytophagales bacterium]
MAFAIKEEGEFQYIDEGQGETLLLLHGLFGALSNWDEVINGFKDEYRVIIPLMPIYDMPLRKAGIKGLTEFVERFVSLKGLSDFTLIGNSLGGHISLSYILKHPEQVKRLVLTGSSGLYENSMGSSFPKRGNYEFIREKVGYTFYDPAVATEELVDHVFATTKSNAKCLRIISIAKSAQRNNMADDIVNIKAPTLLVWGLNDTITPPFVAHEFNRLIPKTELTFIDKCCHAPMMERPQKFNEILKRFLKNN